MTESAQKQFQAHKNAQIDNKKRIKVFATLPKREWVGLTDEEKVDLLNDYEGRLWTDIVPAIEAKLKEKNT
jgi:hypothetical protein